MRETNQLHVSVVQEGLENNDYVRFSVGSASDAVLNCLCEAREKVLKEALQDLNHRYAYTNSKLSERKRNDPRCKEFIQGESQFQDASELVAEWICEAKCRFESIKNSLIVNGIFLESENTEEYLQPHAKFIAYGSSSEDIVTFAIASKFREHRLINCLRSNTMIVLKLAQLLITKDPRCQAFVNGVEGRMDASEIALILLSEIEPRKQKADAALHSLTFFNKFGFSSDLRQIPGAKLL